MDDYLQIVDNVVMKAYSEGFATPKKELWDKYAIKYRLSSYGYLDEGRYYLNENGINYAISGCSKGLKERYDRQCEIERLSIETQSFTKRKQKWTYRFSISSFVLSILSILSQVGLLSEMLQWISDLAQWICCILE